MSASNRTVVSVVMPVFNGEPFLRESIESVLAQTYSDIELIIVDDGSADDSLEISREFEKKDKRIRVLFHEGNVNRGVSFTRKLGIMNASGDFIAFCDSDDIMEKNKINKQIEFMKNNPQIILNHTGVIAFGPNPEFCRRFEGIMNQSETSGIYNLRERNTWLLGNRICNSTVMVRSEIIKRIDFSFNQKFQVEDWVLWTLLSFEGTFSFIPDQLTRYRYHEESATGRIQKESMTGAYSMLEFYLVLFKKIGAGKFRIKLMLIREILRSLKKLFRLY